jgi:hypothetical protein
MTENFPNAPRDAQGQIIINPVTGHQGGIVGKAAILLNLTYIRSADGITDAICFALHPNQALAIAATLRNAADRILQQQTPAKPDRH